MPNPIKYSTGSETLALKKGNFYIGTGAVGKGPTSETGYYNGITPPTGGYTIYLNKESNGPSIYTASNDAELISLTNSIAGQSYTTAQQCFNYFYGQTDKLLVNQDYPVDYPYIVMDGLILNLDAGITQSYPGSGTTWTDINGLGPKNNGTLINGPTFSGGSIVFDGVNDYANLSNTYNPNLITSTYTIESFLMLTRQTSLLHGSGVLSIGNGSINAGNYELLLLDVFLYARMRTNLTNDATYAPPSSQNYSGLTFNTWNHIISLFDGTYMRLYLNGVEVGSGTDSFSGQTLNVTGINTARIGTRHNNAGAGLFPGRIGLVKLYNRALTQSEVLQNYNAQKGRFGL
jgi:hypothetical protein